ncbi:molybdopterin-dependent oxidoreductase [Chloroflexi bacterium TSY]|nr:molybdopterin-dependent oxidoreductase [Chloroflexi bacterium TSY]
MATENTTPVNEQPENNQSEDQPKKRRRVFSRRNFLIGGAIVLGGSAAALYFGRTPIRRSLHHFMAEAGGPHGISGFEPEIVFEMQPDNTLQINFAKAEMGQGIVTGIAMLVAEELDIAYENITVKMATSANGLIDAFGTGASATTRSMYVPTRELAATFREMLKTAAAAQWAVDVSQVSTADGVVSSGSNSVTYINVVNSTTEWEIPDTPELRPRSSFKVVGTEKPRIDLKPKVMGDAIFGLDQEVPDMLHANVLKCPFIEGTLQSMDVAAAKAFPGVVDVVELDDLVAVVAENRYAAEMGKRKLNAQWDVPKVWQQAEIDERLTVGNEDVTPVNLLRNGNAVRTIEADGGTVIEAEYRVPIGVHAHMEPNSAIVDVREDSALVITATQSAGLARSDVASATGLDTDNVEVQTAYLGGGFGRRYALNPAGDAARISQAVGRPVQIVWDRETEFLCGVVRPATHHILRAKLNDAGELIAMNHELASGDQGLGLFPLPFSLKPILGADIVSAGHGAAFLYNIEHGEANIWHIDMPFLTSIWRGVGMYPNGFAIESFMDEVARAANQDPFDLRLAHLPEEPEKHERWKEMLLQLREESGWDESKADGIGRGMAIIEDRITVAAAVVEAKIVDGNIRVHKVTSAVDPGVVINPDGVRQQVEGCAMMGISSALYEDNFIEDGQFHATNYHKYPLAMLSDTPPEINVVMIEGSEVPTGIGEPPIAPIAPAIANAIFDATGIRLRHLPLQKEFSNMS